MSPTITPQSPTGLPSSPRANRQMVLLSPLDTTFSHAQNTNDNHNNQTPNSAQSTNSPCSPTSTLVEHKQHSRSSLIFINATIPLSPTSSTSSELHKGGNPYDGLAPRKRSGFARFFSCLGREERARRRVERETEFVKVGEKGHWSEY